MRGPGIERKWRMGLYFYSTHVSFADNVTVDSVSLMPDIVCEPVRDRYASST